MDNGYNKMLKIYAAALSMPRLIIIRLGEICFYGVALFFSIYYDGGEACPTINFRPPHQTWRIKE
jgi:hypothetical protein